MANQRPIRRGRVPFRRGKRWLSKALHPVRWLDCNSTRSSATSCGAAVWSLGCEVDTAPITMLYGDTDWDWSDASEVRIDRIIGNLSGVHEAMYDGYTLGEPPQALVRFGILAVEETDSPPPIDLFDPEYLEEFQWMWLWQGQGDTDCALEVGNRRIRQTFNIDFDIRTRRKLGKKDGIYLYKQFHHLSSVDHAITYLAPQFALMARAIVRS